MSDVQCGTSNQYKYNFSVKQSWGVGSVRLCAGFPASYLHNGQDKAYCLPLGSQIVCWDVENRERNVCFQGHRDLIICLEFNHRYGIVLTVSYTGEIKLWSNHLDLLVSEQTSFGNAHYGAWSEDGHRFLIVGGPADASLVAVYHLEKSSDGQISFTMLWKHVGIAPAHLGIAKSTSSILNDSVTYVSQKDGYVIAQFNSQGNVIAMFERYHGNASEVHLFDEDGGLKHSQTLDPLDNPKSSIMCTTPCSNGSLAVGFQGGVFLVLNEEDLTIKSVFQATGSPQVAIWDSEYILAVSYLSGVFSWWSTTGQLVHEVKGGPKSSIIHLNWVTNSDHKALWVAGIMSLSYIKFEYSNVNDRFPSKINEDHHIKYHEVTGCGFDLSKDNASGAFAASGDFTGNVFVWSKDQHEPIYSIKHESAIRCLVWKDCNLFIGCLDGFIFKWTPDVLNSLDTCVVCVSGVMSLSWSHDKLAVGLENGNLLLFIFSDEDYLNPVEILNYKAHYQMKDDIESPAEIWSVCWSPCCTSIATASEDQTTCIWNASSGKKLHTLTGHTTAVTSVDWKLMQNGLNLLATCADDRTVRLSDGNTFDVIYVFKLQHLDDWFTFTYLSLNPRSQQCLCTTQNGHLALWDCCTGDLLACHKMHCGSIEGLAWSKDFTEFGTVSSDCVVNVIQCIKQ